MSDMQTNVSDPPNQPPQEQTEVKVPEREGPPHHHVMSLKTLAAVLATLLFLTWLTVAATWVDVGGWNVAIALVIAATKASLVVLFFMHMKYDNPFNAMIVVTALVVVAIFIAAAMMDTREYHDTMLRPSAAPAPADQPVGAG